MTEENSRDTLIKRIIGFYCDKKLFDIQKKETGIVTSVSQLVDQEQIDQLRNRLNKQI